MANSEMADIFTIQIHEALGQDCSFLGLLLRNLN